MHATYELIDGLTRLDLFWLSIYSVRSALVWLHYPESLRRGSATRLVMSAPTRLHSAYQCSVSKQVQINVGSTWGGQPSRIVAGYRGYYSLQVIVVQCGLWDLWPWQSCYVERTGELLLAMFAGHVFLSVKVRSPEGAREECL